MGIPNILKEIGKGERVALSKLAVDHLERTRRPLRIAIDTAIWNFKSQAGRGGAHPELRTLFYKLLRLLALPIHPVFVYDGKNKPLTKRGKTRVAWGSNVHNETSKKLIQLFRYPHHTAPGEAEAECAFLQRHGIVDAVMSEDVDAIMFGSGMTLRNWSKEGTRGNKPPTHVDVHRKADVTTSEGITPAGLVLVALLCGGDYEQSGVKGFGPAVAAEIARAGFGEELADLMAKNDTVGLEEWRSRLQIELETNESGYFKVKRQTVRIPDHFPDRTLFDYYTNPAVSSLSDLQELQVKWVDEWAKKIDIVALRKYGDEKFQWKYDTGAKHFIRQIAAPLLACRLWRSLPGTTITSIDQINGQRLHFSTDGQQELNVTFIPNDVVGLDIDSEEKNPGLTADEILDNDEEALDEMGAQANTEIAAATTTIPQKIRKSAPWDPAAPEKAWILATVLKLGVPDIVEAWEEKQREIHSDPVKFATRKIRTKPQSMLKDSGMRAGALDTFFNSTKPSSGQSRDVSTKATSNPPREVTPNHHPGQTQRVRANRLQNQSNQDKIMNSTPTAIAPQRNRVVSNLLREIESSSIDPTKDDTMNSSSVPAIAVSKIQPTRRAFGQRQQDKATLNPNQVGEKGGSGRRRASRREKIPVVPSPNTPTAQSLPKPNPPIESFFGVKKNKPEAAGKIITSSALTENVYNDIPKPAPVEEDRLALPPDVLQRFNNHLADRRKIAALRDSLPGTWREIDASLIDESSSPRSRGRPRVSYVDLTCE